MMGFAKKTLPSDTDVNCVPRNDLESGLTFLGLLVLCNQLKPETTVVVEELKLAGWLLFSVQISHEHDIRYLI